MKAKKGKTGPPVKKQPDKANKDAVIPQSVGKDKTDCVALANLFMEVSMRLKEEFDIPEIE